MAHIIGSGLLRAGINELGGGIDVLQLKRGNHQWIDVGQNGTLARLADARRSMFLMSPWTTRIENGSFPWSDADRFGASERFQVQGGWHPHAIHGYGPRLKWKVSEVSPNRALLSLDSRDFHEFVYPTSLVLLTEYTIENTDNGGTLTIKHTIRNVGFTAAPVGPGSHGFISKYPGGAMVGPVVEFNATGMFVNRTDCPGNSMPTGEIIPVPETDDFSVARTPEERYDGCYAGWDGKFRAFWEELGLELQIVDASASPTQYLNFWYDKGRGTFAAEPVAIPPNAFNLKAQGVDIDIPVLEAKGSYEFVHRYTWVYV
ncbi:MAG: hypothetical protein U0136_05285 [Bdellovibrionota bacterium]